jgi:NTP pyrophosphatase (non-canonical NTP hydrolase)
MKEDLLKIINHYGVMPQLKYFQSEVFELNEAIIKYEDYYYENYDDGIGKVDWTRWREHIAEEIADVCVMLHQFVEYYKIKPFEIYRVMEQKINRQLERINNENK